MGEIEFAASGIVGDKVHVHVASVSVCTRSFAFTDFGSFELSFFALVWATRLRLTQDLRQRRQSGHVDESTGARREPATRLSQYVVVAQVEVQMSHG